MTYIRQFVEFNPSMLFELLPRKFTAAQLGFFLSWYMTKLWMYVTSIKR